MDETKKISVIVPVYKVEAYLHQCLDSIVNQTYRNLEIILVDDGSPDSCGVICEEYAAKDDRIVVIHQENAGLSAARNTGLDIVSGDYIAFVDSDDWIEPDMFEYLLNNAAAENAAITVCGRIEEYSDRSVVQSWPRREILQRIRAMEILLDDGLMRNYVWDKLWKQELFEGIRFPVGRVMEDLAVTYLLFERADSVLCLPEVKYHYRQRTGSILSAPTLKSRADYMMNALERHRYMKCHWPEFFELTERTCLSAVMNFYSGYVRAAKDARRNYQLEMDMAVAFAAQRDRKRDSSFGLIGRLTLRLMAWPVWWSYCLAGLLGWLYRCRHGKYL